jgi:hypothetical protein
MPIKGAKYRVKKTGAGNIRLAFVNGQVVEAKNLKTGKVHTPSEFKADKAKVKKNKKKKAKK